MPKFKIYEEQEEKEETPINVKLMDLDEDGEITLMAVNDKGHRLDQGSLLKLQKNGQVCMFGRVDSALGFDTDTGGHINTIKN